MEAAQGLSNLSKETNEAWQTFLTLFARDCAQEGHAKASGLLPGRLQFLVDKISEASNSPGTILGPSLFGQLGAVGTNTSASNVGGSIKEEISEESVSSMRFFGTSRNELVSQTGLGWEGEGIRSEENYASGWSLNKGGFSAHNSTLGSSDPVMGKGHSIGPSGMLKPLRPKSAGKEVVKGEALENQKPLKNKMINFSTSDMRSNGSLQELPNSFQQLLGLSDLENKGKDQLLSLEEVHGIVSFVNLVASPHALSQFRQAIIGWRSQGETTELMQATQFVSVLRALNHLEAQSTFSAIATRIKLVQLAEAVDVANITFPSPRGRGNPLVKWLSAQYRQFLHLEYPELKVGSRPWNTKLDDLKRKVKAGRRWQQLISRFGVGIIGLVPVFTPGDQRNIDFNRLIKTNSELCFKLMIKTLERDKCDHIRSMSIKLEEFMLSLFKGNKDPPRLILEGVDPSNIEAQPIDSPQLVTYLDPANPDSIISPVPYGFSSSNAQAVGAHVDLTNGNRLENANPRDSKLERLGLSVENLDEFEPTRKVSGATMNVFMAMLQQEADDKQDGSLFLDSDFFSGINKCISCRAHEAQCDMLDQQGGHCTQCRQMGLICEMPRPSTKLNIDNFHKFNRIFVPTFTKEITHWSLVVISPQKKSVVHFDSLDFSGPDKPAVLSYPLREVVTWVRHLISLAKWDSEGWHEEAVFVSKQPAGGNDCGICTISFARLLQSGLPLPPPGYFTVPLMAKMREVFKTEMLEGKFGNNFYRFQEAQQH